KNHRQALDLIWDRVGSPPSAALAEVADVLKNDPRWHIVYQSTGYVDVLPTSWLEWLPPFDVDDDYPFCVHFRSSEGNIGYSVWVGPLADDAKRATIITKLRKEGPGLGFKASRANRVEGKWNRISAAEIISEWGEGDEPEPAAIRESAKKKLADLHPK